MEKIEVTRGPMIVKGRETEGQKERQTMIRKENEKNVETETATESVGQREGKPALITHFQQMSMGRIHDLLAEEGKSIDYLGINLPPLFYVEVNLKGIYPKSFFSAPAIRFSPGFLHPRSFSVFFWLSFLL